MAGVGLLLTLPPIARELAGAHVLLREPAESDDDGVAQNVAEDDVPQRLRRRLQAELIPYVPVCHEQRRSRVHRERLLRDLEPVRSRAIKGGAVDGVVIGPEQVEVITKLPSREELIARVVGLALAPAQRVISLANAPASGLLGQLKAIAEKEQGGEAPSAEG